MAAKGDEEAAVEQKPKVKKERKTFELPGQTKELDPKGVRAHARAPCHARASKPEPHRARETLDAYAG